jgi:hypothetical protein
MFHVKHFGTIGAENVIWPQTAVPPSTCKIDRFFGAIPEARRRRLDGLAGLREVIPDVRFADRIEVVTPPHGLIRHKQYADRKRRNIFALELCTKKALQYQWPNFVAEFLNFAPTRPWGPKPTCNTPACMVLHA